MVPEAEGEAEDKEQQSYRETQLQPLEVDELRREPPEALQRRPDEDFMRRRAEMDATETTPVLRTPTDVLGQYGAVCRSQTTSRQEFLRRRTEMEAAETAPLLRPSAEELMAEQVRRERAQQAPQQAEVEASRPQTQQTSDSAGERWMQPRRRQCCEDLTWYSVR